MLQTLTEILYRIDFAVLDLIQSYCRSPLGDTIMTFFSRIGDLGTVWLLLALLLIIRRPTRRTGIAILAALLLANLLGNYILKPLIGRPRPFMLSPLDGLPEIALLENSFSFPSGHTISSFAAATALFVHNKRLGTPALLLAALIAFSRLYIYVHFPSDVLAGTLLGWLIGCITARLITAQTPQ